MNRPLLITGALLCFLGVALGAFGAHGLKAALGSASDAAQRLTWWETGARYHLFHGLAVCLAAIAAAHVPGRSPWLAASGFVLGIVLFSGSLYVMGLTGLRALGAITPIGGLFQLGGWLALAYAATRLP